MALARRDRHHLGSACPVADFRAARSGEQQAGRQVRRAMHKGTGNKAATVVPEPSEQPTSDELHGKHRPQAHIDQQQQHVRHKEYDGLEQVAPSEPEAPHQSAANEPAEQDFLAQCTQRNPDHRTDGAELRDGDARHFEDVGWRHGDGQPTGEHQDRQQEQCQPIGSGRAPSDSRVRKRRSEVPARQMYEQIHDGRPEQQQEVKHVTILGPTAPTVRLRSMGDELYESEKKQSMTREQAAERLREIADQLSRHNEVRVNHGDRDVSVKVADQVELEVEVEIEPGHESELEITITW